MNADITPTEIELVLLFELLFGIGYNALVALWNKHKLVHVSLEVAIGVTGALLIPTDDIAVKAKDDQLRVQDLAYYVNVLHSVIGMLKSL